MAEKKIKKIEATKPLYSNNFQNYSRKRRVAAYARVSTDKEEQESSFDAQVSYYTQKIQANPQWVFVEVYADEGITGTSMKKRDGFNRMIDDALAGKIDLILTKSVSRFARNTVDSLTTVRKLKDKGVEVYFEKENIYTLDSKGELLITIMSSLAQEEARSISENTAWGRRKQFADGKYSLAYSTFLGYDKGPNGELVINEDEAPIIRRIYDEYLAGLSPYMIAKKLTADGIETPAHKTVWQPSTVQSILTNEKYYGAATLQKTVVVDFLSKKVRPNRGELPSYYITEDHEAIIAPVKFRMVQEEMERRKKAGRKAQGVSFFSGRIVCGDCGGFYGRKIWHSNTENASWHWHCNNKFMKRKYCTTPTLKEESLQETFVEVFNGLIRRKKEIEENYRLCLAVITDTTEYERQMEELDKEATEVQALIRSLLIEYGRSADSNNIAAQYEEYERRLDAIARLREDLDMKIASCSLKRTQVTAFLMELKKHEHPLSEFDPLVWQATVNHARVDHDCNITFCFRDGSEVKTKIRNGVRQYRKRSKGEHTDG
jgi:site-specific DNA recombinase